MHGIIRLVITLICVIACGCAQVPKTSPTGKAQDINSWHISGALSLQPQGQSSSIVNYTWLQKGSSEYLIHLSSALNLYQVNLLNQNNRVTLTQANKPPQTGVSAEDILQKNLHWSLPISNFYYWVRGVPAPGNYRANYDKRGHIMALNQEGWIIQFENYRRVKGIDLPHKITAYRVGLRTKIVVKQWTIS